MEEQDKAVMAVSGGLDSTTLLHYAVKTLSYDVHALAFNYGQRHARELRCAITQCQELDVPLTLISLPELEHIASKMSALVNTNIAVPNIKDVMGDPQPVTYVPNRNVIFLAYAVAYAESIGAHKVLYGIQKHDQYGYWDTTPSFAAATNAVYRLNRKNPIVIETPFVEKSKTDEIMLGLLLGVDYAWTWSCYQGEDQACGVCPTCAERLQAFMNVGIPDPIPYMTLPDKYRTRFANQTVVGV